MQKTWYKRLLSLTLAVVCVMGLFPTAALAADTAPPDNVTLQGVTFSGNYTSQTLGTCGVHQMTMNVGAETHDAFCAEHGKGMGTSLIGHPWSGAAPVNHPAIQLMMGYYYTHKEALYTDACIAKGFNYTYQDTAYGNLMNAWTQAVCWLALEGNLPSSGEPLKEAMAKELMYVCNGLRSANSTDIKTDNVPGTGNTYYMVASMIVDNPDCWVPTTVYKYTYAGSGSSTQPANNVQAMLVGIPALDVSPADNYEIIVKKVDSTNPTKGLPGATFTLKRQDGSSVKNGTTGANGTLIFDKLEAGTYFVYENSAPAGYKIDNPGPYIVTLPGTGGASTVTVTAYDTIDITSSGSIRKVDKDIPTMGLAGATIKITGVDNNFVFQGQTVAGGALADVPWDTMPIGSYVVEETGAPSGYILDSQKKEFYWDGKSDVNLVFENESKVKVQLIKKDTAGNPLPGALYTVLKDGQILFSRLTDGNGTITVTDVTEGLYTFLEKEAPAGYVTNHEPVNAYVDAAAVQGGETVVVEAVNHEKPGLTIVKRDANTGLFVEGCTFDIRQIDGTYHERRTTDGIGRIHLENMSTGSYVVTEIAVPEGYNLNPTPQTVELVQDESYTLTFENTPKATMELFKHDSNGRPISGATFDVAKKGGASLGEFTTDATGKLTVPNLEPGIYTATETDCPTDYILDTAPHEFEVKEGVTKVSVDVVNLKKPEITIHKVDSIVGGPVEGAKFEAFYAGTGGTGAPAGTYRSLGIYYTNANGEIKLDHLDEGWHRFTELEAPAGYQIKDPATQEIFLKGDDKASLTFKNTPLSAIIVLKRDGVNGKPVPGCTFQLRYLGGTSGTGGTAIGEKVTSQSGTAIWTSLEAGTYIIEEINSADGYNIAEAAKTVYISGKDQDVITVTFDNTPDGTLLIKKVDSKTPAKALAGAEFKVRYTDGSLIGQDNGIFTTDANGTITISGLEPGKSVIATETKAPDGYVMDGKPQTIVIQAGKVVSLTFSNDPKGQLIIEKRAEGTNELLPGAEFVIRRVDGTEVGSDGNIISGKDGIILGSGTISSNSHFVTGGDGKITITGLQPGNYTITEVKAPEGYLIGNDPTRTIQITAGDTQTITFKNPSTASLLIKKVCSTSPDKMLEGAVFDVRYADGTVVGESNGVYETDANGTILITGLEANKSIVVTETSAPDGFVIDTTPQTITTIAGKVVQLTFANTPKGQLTIVKVDANSGKRLEGAMIEVAKMNGEIIGTYVTDKNGVIQCPELEDGWYQLTELKAPKGYLLDPTPQKIEVKEGEAKTFTFENTASASMLIHKIDSVTGKGIQGVKFMVYDSSMTPIGEYESDDQGYVHLNKTLSDGKYYVREIVAADGYILDNETKSFYVLAGDTATIEWKNTPELGQIQVYKTSAGYSPVNGLPAGTPLSGAVFAIYDKRQNVVDTIKTNENGIASSKKLPLETYTVKEVEAPTNYGLNTTVFTADLEFAGQVVKLNVEDPVITTGVSIKKTGYQQTMNNNIIRYTVSGVSNDSSVSLLSFYWRDTIPTDAMRLTRLVTGTYSTTQTYKVTYTTNLSNGQWRTAYDNLSTAKNYTLDMTEQALGLASNEYVTQFMLSFGVVPAGFHQLTNAIVDGKTLYALTNNYKFTNKADVGGLNGSSWVQSIARWTTTIYSNYVAPQPTAPVITSPTITKDPTTSTLPWVMNTLPRTD